MSKRRKKRRLEPQPDKPKLCTLGTSGIHYPADRGELDDWLVVLHVQPEDKRLWWDTNLEACLLHLQIRYGDNAAMFIRDLDELLLIVRPEPPALVAAAESMSAMLESGDHFDIDLYETALAEAVNEHWQSEMEPPDRIDLVLRHDLDIELALNDEKAPDEVHPYIADWLEG